MSRQDTIPQEVTHKSKKFHMSNLLSSTMLKNISLELSPFVDFTANLELGPIP